MGKIQIDQLLHYSTQCIHMGILIMITLIFLLATIIICPKQLDSNQEILYLAFTSTCNVCIPNYASVISNKKTYILSLVYNTDL